MISLDTNLLIYARVEANPWHEPARAFLQSLAENPDVVIAELVLVDFYSLPICPDARWLARQRD